MEFGESTVSGGNTIKCIEHREEGTTYTFPIPRRAYSATFNAPVGVDQRCGSDGGRKVSDDGRNNGFDGGLGVTRRRGWV